MGDTWKRDRILDKNVMEGKTYVNAPPLRRGIHAKPVIPDRSIKLSNLGK
jgi:hypothetical protein